MKSTLRRILTVGATVATVALAVPAPAYAINTVTCSPPLEWVHFLMIDNAKSHCFANAGNMAVAIYDVHRIASGNNNVTIEFIDDVNGPVRSFYIPKNRWWHSQFSDTSGTNGNIHKVFKINIH